MNRNSAILVLAVVLPILCMWIALPAASQPFFYETRFVGANPSVYDFAVMSVQEDPSLPVPQDFQGIFADFSTGGVVGAANTAAVLDCSYIWRAQSFFHPTGQLFVAKTTPGSSNIIDGYWPVSNSASWLTRQNLPGPGASYDNTARVWRFGTASLNAVQAMDIACGVIDPNVGPQGCTNFLITAEPLNGMVWLVAYGLTNQAGGLVGPFLVNGVSTGIANSTCLGLTVSPGRVGANPTERTLNEVVFVTTDPVNGMMARAVTFDVRTMVFGATPTTYQAPFPLPGNSIAGIWIAQTDPTAQPLVLAHHVGISIPHPQLPATQRGTLVILPASTSTTLAPITKANVGGGPLSHVPWGHNNGGGMSGGPAYYAFFGNPNGPTGWYVVTPGGLLNRTSIETVDVAGNNAFFALYPAGASPNGTPLAHPADISSSGIAAQRKGALWVPYLSAGATFSFDLLEGAPLGTWFTTAVDSIGSGILPAGNFPLRPVLPLQVGLPWPGAVILQDQKTNLETEYGMYIIGH